MDYQEFLAIVERAAGLPREDAERAARVTLQTLAERIASGEARDLAERLPPELAPWIATKSPAEGFDVDEFLARVATREGTDVATAESHARWVFTALGRAAGADELEDIRAELSKDYWPLLPRGPYVEVMPADVFWQRVAERAAIDQEAARRATDAVLETLAERIAGGEVDDLISRLPIALHAPLKRARDRGDGRARKMSLEDFVRRVAERGAVSAPGAREQTRAVLRTLREAVGDDEFFDVTVQLPDSYEAALGTT
jgi:uncharacterized protein (DUF2267 family)